MLPHLIVELDGYRLPGRASSFEAIAREIAAYGKRWRVIRITWRAMRAAARTRRRARAGAPCCRSACSRPARRSGRARHFASLRSATLLPGPCGYGQIYAACRSRAACTSSSSTEATASIGGSVNASRATRDGDGAEGRLVEQPLDRGADRLRPLGVGREPGAELGDPAGVVGLVGEQRHDDLRDAGEQRAERGAEAAVADDRGRLAEDLRLRDPALGAHVARAAARARPGRRRRRRSRRCGPAGRRARR